MAPAVERAKFSRDLERRFDDLSAAAAAAAAAGSSVGDFRLEVEFGGGDETGASKDEGTAATSDFSCTQRIIALHQSVPNAHALHARNRRLRS